MKEQILKSLESMSKAELSKEIGISVFTLNKLIKHGVYSLRSDSAQKVKSYYKEKTTEDSEKKSEEKYLTKNRVQLSIAMPELTEDEVKFFNTLKIDTINYKISALGYINYIFTSSNKFTQHWYKKLAMGKNKADIESLVKRLGLAVLCGKYTLKEQEKTWFIKLPSEHYLCKYDNGDMGWSVEPNRYTVTSKDKGELEKAYPEYINFIFSNDALIKSYKGKTRGFSISERIRNKN